MEKKQFTIWAELKKKSDVYVRFYSSAAGTMTINSVKFEGVRDVTIASDLPKVSNRVKAEV